MTQIIFGDRIAKNAKIGVGSVAALFDESGKRLFLTKRSDNGLWCLPGGGMEPGEELAETCVREVLEETGLHVKVKRLIGIYSSPNVIIWYDTGSGDKVQVVSAMFEVELVGGELTVSSETTEFGYFFQNEIEDLTLMENQRNRVADAFAKQEAAYIR
ncbi:MAG: NUDIX domain-containing protein [Chloroflexota bacterium]